MHSLRLLKMLPVAFSKENTSCAATMQRGRDHLTYCAAAYLRNCEETSIPLQKNSTKAGRNGLIYFAAHIFLIMLFTILNITIPAPKVIHKQSFNLLKAKRTLLYLKTQVVPRSKHFSSGHKNQFML